MSEKMGRPTETPVRPHTLNFPEDLWVAIDKVKGTQTVTAFIMEHLAAIPEVAAQLKKRGKKQA